MFDKNFVTRVITGVFILALMLAMIFINNYFLLVSCIVLSLIAIYELSDAFKKINLRVHLVLAYLFNIIFIVVSYYFSDKYLMPLLSMYIIAMLIFMIFNDKMTLKSVIVNSFLAIYITLSYSYFIIIREPMWLLYTFGISSLTDSFAYIVGMLFGKHKLNEGLSPNKTIEGSIGGVIGAVIFAIIFRSVYNLDISLYIVILVTIVLSVISQIGDLIASYIKRKTGIKDYGYIFKGHGGVMDRFDSVLLLTPIMSALIPFL